MVKQLDLEERSFKLGLSKVSESESFDPVWRILLGRMALWINVYVLEIGRLPV